MNQTKPCRLAAGNHRMVGGGAGCPSDRVAAGARPWSFDPPGRRRRLPRGVAALLAAAVCVGALGGGREARAEVTTLPVNKCLAGKFKGTGKYHSQWLGCFAKGLASLGLPDDECLHKTEEDFTGGEDPSSGPFGKLEAKYPSSAAVPCLTFGDAPLLQVALWEFQGALVEITGNSVGRCDAGKIRCVAKYIDASLQCRAKAGTRDGAIDPKCRENAAEKLTNLRNGCLVQVVLQSDDCTFMVSTRAELLALGDSYVEQLTCMLSPGNPGCP